MLENITLGQFFPGTSALHRMDPRAKLLLTVLLIVAVFVAKNPLSYLLLFGFILFAAWLSGVGFKFIFRAIKPVLFLVAFTFVLNLLFTRSGDVVFQFWWITITTGGLKTASSLAVRLILLVLASQLMMLTTSPISLTNALEQMLRPLSKLGFPGHELAMIMSIALRFIPTLTEEADKIMKAQKARGADFESGSLVAKAKAMLPLLVPLFVSAFRRAYELAMAMEARCYHGGEGRTRMTVLKMGSVDYAATLVVLLLLALVIALGALL